MSKDEIVVLLDKMCMHMHEVQSIIKTIKNGTKPEIGKDWPTIISIRIDAESLDVHCDEFENVLPMEKYEKRKCDIFPMERSAKLFGVKFFEIGKWEVKQDD